MLTDSGIAKIRLRGTNPQLAAMLPGLYDLNARCTSFGQFVDNAVSFLASQNLSVMTLEYHAGAREVTFMVRG